MSAAAILSAVLLVLGIVSGAALVTLRSRQRSRQLREAVEKMGQRLILGPEPCAFRAKGTPYDDLRGNAVACLTDACLLVFGLRDEAVGIPLEQLSNPALGGNAVFGTGGKYLSLRLSGGGSIDLLLLKRPNQWISEIEQRHRSLGVEYET